MAIDEPGSAPTGENSLACTVTFGRSSFVGRSLVSALLKSGRWTVRIADPLPLPDPSADPLLSGSIRSGRASYFQVGLRDSSQLRHAVAGSVVVFHVAPPAVLSPPLPPSDFYRLYTETVQGAKNLIAACRACGVRRLVHTGSADVVFDGVHGIDGGDESLRYPDKFEGVLSELMAQVEILVFNANGRDGLSTCVLRPSNPFGPGDSSFLPFLVAAARLGLAKFIIGTGKNMCDFTYVENVAHANICAEQALRSESTSVAGKPIFITNHQPVELWDFISNILEGLGYQRPTIHLPVKLVLLVVVLANKVREKLGFGIPSSPLFTPAITYTLSCTRTFNCSAAKRLIGYSPIISLEDGVMSTLESFLQLAKDSAYSRKRDFTTPSKADKLLGSGVVADILLWRDERKTFTYLLSSYMLFYWFLLSGRTFISSTAKILLLVAVILFVHGFVPSSMFGFNLEKMSSSYFQVSESTVRQSFITMASLWNKVVSVLKLLAQGDDWNVFFKAAGFLYVVKLLLPFPLSALIGVGLTCLFSLFIIYEQCEEEVDKLVSTASAGIRKLKERMVANLPSFLVTYLQELKN
ncbi:3beta-hydroxysteroid-dehydrogenase/decarboxylase isoform X2 [Phoenix dactylifera]|uniref:Reticulon-like protein n=1 Tax=Phoenix dactylifera TaxID=42345 RepID=A0A8B7BYW1_PHODC|nr:3beta-hydroxysteroid-dehydrogenase/decarboxylase isoform X2 [Phoenix dactylifera]